MNNWAPFTFIKIRKQGFTLAEVLITLAIIGVVAAMTIPTLMNSTNNQETVAKVKKTYATATQAFRRAEADNGSAEGWGWTVSTSTGAQNVFNILAPYLNITKNCGTTSSGCFPDITYPKLSGGVSNENIESNSIYAKAQLADGTLVTVLSRDSNCDGIRGTSLALNNVCGWILFDVNGFKAPNQWGMDMFGFYITKYGVIPSGTSSEITYPPSSCNKINGYGTACTAWILQQGNMDYLK